MPSSTREPPPDRQRERPSDGAGDRPSDRIVELPDAPGTARARGGSEAATFLGAPAHSRAAWLLPPLLIGAIGLGFWVLTQRPEGLFGLVFGGLVAVGLLWIVVSSLLPGKADRTCPSCGRKGLRRLDRSSTTGLRCAHCGWRDETASSFLLAEEEGPLEDLVLDRRDRKHEDRELSDP